MTHIRRYLPLLVLPIFCIQPALAQSTVDLNMGFGAPQDKANAGWDNSLNAAGTALGPTWGQLCGASTITCAKTPSLSGFMMGFGANAILWKKFGVGGEANFQAGKQTYADVTSAGQGIIQSRVTLYDFNGIYQPISQQKVAVQLLGGIGGANFKEYQNTSGGSGSLIGNTAYSNYPISSSNHFQVHAGVGVQLYVSGNLFIRPQFDIHYVPNFIQFGRNLMTSETVWVGYTLGERQ